MQMHKVHKYISVQMHLYDYKYIHTKYTSIYSPKMQAGWDVEDVDRNLTDVYILNIPQL